MALELVGWAAVALTSTMFIPQVLSAYRTNDLKAISQTTYVMLCISACLWIVHGIYKSDPTVIVANVFVLGCSIAILIRKTTASGGFSSSAEDTR